ncbi:hypothetical protein LSCM1_07498 [Leishmania martiniquensis]|uniref:Uncharacterized protein n=1 Tax=Leishmania martiniquensis TaxID=1580590 RepID=A0A836I018_9TRYP|nr:hypothetical protein LSCM1_07498 [Leishmania martiniquensis]
MWLFSSSVAAARPLPSPTSSPSAKRYDNASLPLELRLIRVSKADISCVTADDVKRVRERLTSDELTTALRLLVETNRFADIIASVSSSTWAEAAAGVTAVQMGLSGGVMRDRMSLLYSILPYVSDSFLTTMGSPFAGDH